MKDGKTIYIDGKVLVNDYSKDNNNLAELKEYEYQDNILEIFEEENIIEELENKKIELNDRIENNNIAIKSSNKSIKTLIGIFVGFPLFTALLGNFMSSNTTLFGVEQQWLSMGICGTFISSIVIPFQFYIFKKVKKLAEKDNNGIKLQLEELNKELNKNNELLNQLKNNKTKENQEEAMIKRIDDIHNIHLEKYRKIRRMLFIFQEIGENEDKFYEYYKNNMLEEKLNDSCDPDEIEKVKKYFKYKN